LTHIELKDHFTSVFTNPAHFDDTELLNVSWYHSKEAGPHGCSNCQVNMCKGSILTQVLEEKSKQDLHYESILYVGDGEGDYCPATRLR
jgi:pyridoxal phosphate phosphatase PHOSPHO2